jgi:hypothetical protein
MAKKKENAPKAVYSVVKIIGDRLVADPPRKTVAIPGKVVVMQEHEAFWGPGKDFEVWLENPTYADLFRVASRQIKVTGDWHHVYFEGFRIRRKVGNNTVIELCMGS